MKSVTIAFENEADLRRFRSIIRATEYEINLRQLTIECNCDDKDIEFALTHLSARVNKTWDNLLTRA